MKILWSGGRVGVSEKVEAVLRQNQMFRMRWACTQSVHEFVAQRIDDLKGVVHVLLLREVYCDFVVFEFSKAYHFSSVDDIYNLGFKHHIKFEVGLTGQVLLDDFDRFLDG